LNQAAKVFIFIGPPGAGKGSLSTLCVRRFGWVQISTGNLCRKHIAEQTKIGKEIDLIIKSGKLINDDLINTMVFEWFNEHAGRSSGIIFDGYPRTVAQAEAFGAMLNEMFPAVRVHVVLFELADDVVVDRLCSRYVRIKNVRRFIHFLHIQILRQLYQLYAIYVLGILAEEMMIARLPLESVLIFIIDMNSN
jgi:adenylate kinase family enzyme